MVQQYWVDGCAPVQDFHTVYSVDGLSGEKTNVLAWESTNAELTIIAVHGGTSHPGDYENVGIYFQSKGISVICPQLRGHGSNKKVHINRFDDFLTDLSAVIKWVDNKYSGTQIVLMGHSLGGLIATKFLIEKAPFSDKVQLCVLSAPFYRPADKVNALKEQTVRLVSKFAPKMTCPREGHAQFLTSDPYQHERVQNEINANIRASKISHRFAIETLDAQQVVRDNFSSLDTKTLVLVAGNDKVSCSSTINSLIFKNKLPSVSYEMFPFNMHENFNEKNRNLIFNKVEAWIYREISSVSCAASREKSTNRYAAKTRCTDAEHQSAET